MVDLWGGLLFNVVSWIVVEYIECMGLIIGLNLLMLIEVYIVCDKLIDEVIVYFEEIGKIGIKYFKLL